RPCSSDCTAMQAPGYRPACRCSAAAGCRSDRKGAPGVSGRENPQWEAASRLHLPPLNLVPGGVDRREPFVGDADEFLRDAARTHPVWVVLLPQTPILPPQLLIVPSPLGPEHEVGIGGVDHVPRAD